jgi:hypothetical protein
MAHPKKIHIKESIKELKALQRKAGELVSKRIAVLIAIKNNEKTGISKRSLSNSTGVNHNSALKWQNMYIASGISSLLTHGRKGFKKPILSAKEHKLVENKLKDPKNGLQGYVELHQWIENDYGVIIKYNTLLKYSRKHFQSKIKVARKSHINKDVTEVDAFKKSLVKSAKMLSSKRTKTSKK